VEGVDLGHGKFRRASTEDGVIRIIQDGIPGTAMPAQQTLAIFRPGPSWPICARLPLAAGRLLLMETLRAAKAIFQGKGGCAELPSRLTELVRALARPERYRALRRVAEIELSILDPNAEVLAQESLLPRDNQERRDHHWGGC